MQQDTSVGSLANCMNEAAQPRYTSFGVQAFPDVFDAHTQAAIVPEVTHFGRNQLMLSAIVI